MCLSLSDFLAESKGWADENHLKFTCNILIQVSPVVKRNEGQAAWIKRGWN
jgi:hypothetical protein